MAAKLQSPGVRISEVDLSLRPVQDATTTIFIPGFAQKGPTQDAIKIASISEFEQIYGQPTNGAERYFYHTVNAALQSPADVLVSRLPYGSGQSKDTYALLAYPATYISSSYTSAANPTSADQHFLQTSGTYLIGKPIPYELTKSEFDKWIEGSLFTYSSSCGTDLSSNNLNTLGNAAFIVGNQTQSDINGLYEGLYLAIADNTTVNPDNDNNTIRSVVSLSSSKSYISLDPARLNNGLKSLTGAANDEGSISQVLEDNAIAFGVVDSRAYDDVISINIFKLKQSVFSDNSIALGFSLIENHFGSLNSHTRQNSEQGGPSVSFFLDTVSNKSRNITVKTNPFFSRLVQGGSWAGTNGNPSVKVRVASPTLYDYKFFTSTDNNYESNRVNIIGLSSLEATSPALTGKGTADALFPLGTYNSESLATKVIGNVPAKLQTIFDTFRNPDIYPFDIACEAGLGTIYAVANYNTVQPLTGSVFDDFTYLNIGSAGNEGLNATGLYSQGSFNYSNDGSVASNHNAVLDKFIGLAEDDARKDFLIISDPVTNIFVQGNASKIADREGNTINRNIYWPLRNLYAKYNTSYVATYANCVKINDSTSGIQTWVPFSGYAAAIMANTDTNFQPWYAPAGFIRGIVNNALDLGIYPRQKERDSLYKASLNPVAFFPSEGFVVYGQKTLLKRPSAFDRINVRRLFINLEKITRDTLKFFVFEPNTLLTRTRVLNTLTPIFENAKNTEGLFDYLIICDERNNTPQVIDQNELIVDIYLKPVRTAEFILANFYATRTNVNFQEIVS